MKEPKTKSSRRQIALPTAIVEALADHRKRMFAEGHAKTQYVFCNQHGGPLRRSHFYRESFRPLLTRAKLPANTHFHHLRHAHASILIAQGENPKLVSSRLGHSKIGITMDTYGHLMQGIDRGAADRLNAMFPSKAKIGGRQCVELVVKLVVRRLPDRKAIACPGWNRAKWASQSSVRR